jgi:cell division initiation protein
MLTPVDLQTREFRKALRGYDMHDVDEYFDRVTAEFERLFRANVQQRDEIDNLKQRIEEYRQMEATLRDTLMVAQEASQQLKAAAQREAEAIIKEAQEKARRSAEDVEDRIRLKKHVLEELAQREELFKIRFRALLESYLATLDESRSSAALKIEKDYAQGVSEISGVPSGSASLVSDAFAGLRQAATGSDDTDGMDE